MPSTKAAVDLPYLIRIRARGRDYDYFRHKGLRTPLPGQPDSPEFMAAYRRSLQAAKAPAAARTGAGSLGALIEAYRASDEWAQLKPATRLDYNKALTPLKDRFAQLPVETMPRGFVFALRDEYARKPELDADGKPVLDAQGEPAFLRTPRRGNRMVAVLSLLMSWRRPRLAEGQPVFKA